mgnify:CR=1 FL=1
MQTCLNREHQQNIKDLKKYPAFVAFLIVLLLITIVFDVIGSLCAVMWTCPGPMDASFLALGISLTLFFTIFIIIPYTLLFLLNCCFPFSNEETTVSDETFVSYNKLYQGRSRSKSKTKVRVLEELV